MSNQPLITLLVRLMGVFFVIDGATGLIGHGIDLAGHWHYARVYNTGFQAGYALAWFLASGFVTGMGLLLIFRSGFAVDAIDHERLHHDARDDAG